MIDKQKALDLIAAIEAKMDMQRELLAQLKASLADPDPKIVTIADAMKQPIWRVYDGGDCITLSYLLGVAVGQTHAAAMASAEKLAASRGLRRVGAMKWAKT